MYESPISITERIAHEIENEKDNQIFKAIAQIVVDVDKDEIIKALKYDRGQYEKGYRDGLKAAVIHAHRYKDYGVCKFDFRSYETYRCSNCKGEIDND